MHIPIFLQQNNAYIIYKHTYRCECIDIIWERKFSKPLDGLSKDFHTKFFTDNHVDSIIHILIFSETLFFKFFNYLFFKNVEI